MSNFRRRLMMSLKNKEYTRLEYIESTGTQYIDTKFTENSSSTGYYVKYQNSANHIGDDTVMGVLNPNRCIGTEKLQAWTCWKETGAGMDGSQKVVIVSTDIVESYLNYLNSQKRRIDVNEQTKMIGDISSVTSINNKSCYIFATNNNGFAYGNASGIRVYGAKITLDNKIVRDYIPVLDKMGVPCLYDKVEGKFYYNQGKGEFLYK